MAGLSIPTFEEGTEVDSFLERVECYFSVSGTEDDKKVPVLLMGLSAAQYQTLRDLVSPAVPRTVGYEALKDHLVSHFGTPRNQRLERTKFRSIVRSEGESFGDFQIRIRKGARYCNFAEKLDENLLEQFISGVNHSVLSRKLIENNDITTLAGAMEVAGTIQLLDRDSRTAVVVNNTDTMTNVARVSARGYSNRDSRTNNNKRGPRKDYTDSKGSSTGGNKSAICFRCSRAGHVASDRSCPARGRTCNACRKVGHFAGAKFCHKSGKKPASTNAIVSELASSNRTDNPVNPSVVDNFGYEFAVRNSLTNSSTPKRTVLLNGKTVTFLIDSGAVDNIIDRNTYKFICDSVALQPASKSLYAFGQSKPLRMLGQFSTNVSCNNNCVNTVFYVFDGNACNLMSADTARKLEILCLNNIYNVSAIIGRDLENFVKTKYPECFSGVGKLKDVQVKLHINPDCEPVAQPVRRLPFSYRARVEKALAKLVEEDIIEVVEGIGSTWVSPLVVVPKEGEDVRLCVDMRRANTAIVRERYPVPTMQEMLVELNGSTIFSKLDLRQGFFQCELEPSSRAITTFVTHCGLFQMKRLGMGVSSAPEVFQYTIQKVLNGLNGALNLADDIVVFGKDPAEHKERLLKVMERFSNCGLTLNSSKCQFGVKSIKFLGHIISSDGVSPDPAKVKSIVSVRVPQNVAELRGFLGLVQFVGRYVPDLAAVSSPLWSLTKKSVHFKWSKVHQDAFDKIKYLMASCKTLAYYDRNAPTIVVADAGPKGLGGVLCQVKDGISKVVAYGHRRLTDVESRYSQIEREALALVWACEHFKMYLLGKHFQLFTDHKPLVSIFNKPGSKPTPRLERWSIRLQAFDYNLLYKRGSENIADPMSRLSILEEDTIEPVTDDSYIYAVVENAMPCALSWAEVQEAALVCEESKLINKALQTGDWRSHPAMLKSVREELSCCDGVILRGDRIFVPLSLRPRVIWLAHEGHQGIVKTKRRLRLKVWWPGMDKEVEAFCRQCMSCQLVSNSDPPAPIIPTKMPDGPWRFCSIDLLGPLPDGRSVVVIVDYFSRTFEFSFLKSVKAEKIILFLERVFSCYGFPELLRSDNGPQFVSSEFQQYLKQCGIGWISTTPLWPQANGEVERTNRTILKVLKIAKEEGIGLEKALRDFSIAYKSTPHTGTGATPFSLMFNREMRTKLPMFKDVSTRSVEEAKDFDCLYKYNMKEYADRGRKVPDIQTGDSVVMRQENRGKLDTNYGSDEHTVVGLHGSDVVCSSPSGSIVRRNVSFAKKLQTDSSSPSSSANSSDQVPVLEVTPSTPVPTPRASSRTRKVPSRFDDYKLY